ncbi:hypothetical protein [Companilactobacillus kimchiensis]|uniref:hypothetical protein n=1 Tax=Companilactobacillus kimchiensis TaxID=993692 RepID=UPI00070CAAB0|nr:hypothetical protein [Companilactobacillus kimchiensis]
MGKRRDFKSKKLFWSFLLFVDVLLFIEALATNTIWVLFVVMVISEIIHFKGNKYLFGKFDMERKEKREVRRREYLKQQAVNSGK